MTNHPPPPLLHRPTTTQILKQTTAVFTTRHHLLPFLFLSFFLLFFRNETETLTDSLISFIDNDLSIKSIFPPKPTIQNHHHQLTQELDFFTEFSEKNSFTTNPQTNSTSIILNSFNTHLGFSNSALSFELIEKNNTSDRHTEIEHQYSSALYSVLDCIGSYVCIVFVYTLSQVCIRGVIFVLVVNHFLKNRNPFIITFRRGTNLGTERLLLPIEIRWLIRDLLGQFLAVWFFREIGDEYSFFKILIRSKFMHLSVAFPLVNGFENETVGFLLSYFSLDMLFSFVFGVGVWVVMVDSRKTFWEAMREGYYMLLLSTKPAINLKCLEIIVSGSLAKVILSQVFGGFLASVIQSLMVIYFMVAWMMYYLSVKLMDVDSRCVSFGQTEFEAMLKSDED